jgi:hypothetical protein
VRNPRETAGSSLTARKDNTSLSNRLGGYDLIAAFIDTRVRITVLLTLRLCLLACPQSRSKTPHTDSTETTFSLLG